MGRMDEFYLRHKDERKGRKRCRAEKVLGKDDDSE
jgi:hypothetical protein